MLGAGMNPGNARSPEPIDRVNLYLVGFMGTGKSTVARMLANRLRLHWIDSDAEIEKNEGRPISEIFADVGEVAFRRLESTFMESGHPSRGCVVSCGGGLVTIPGMIDQMKAKGVVVCLLANPATIHERTRHNRNRPLLEVDDPEGRIEAMLQVREPFYRKAGTQILTDHRPLTDVAMHVNRIYQRESREFDRK